MPEPVEVIGAAQEIAKNEARKAAGLFSGVMRGIQPYLDKYGLYALLGLFLSALAAWGSREVHYRKITKELTIASDNTKTQLDRTQSDLTKALEQIKQYSHTTTNTHTVTLPNGTTVQDINEVNQTWTDTYMALMHQAEAREKALTDKVATLENKNSELETKVISSSPRWSLTGSYDLLGGDDWRERLRLGAGINLSLLSVGASIRAFGPAADSNNDLGDVKWWAKFHPSMDAAFRF